jgi:hypothetical protein
LVSWPPGHLAPHREKEGTIKEGKETEQNGTWKTKGKKKGNEMKGKKGRSNWEVRRRFSDAPFTMLSVCRL